VGQCADGESALALVRDLRPQLAVVDLNLPRLFTMELIRKARQSDLATRFVVLSDRADQKTVIEALRCGAAAFVLKSEPAARFVEALEQSLRGGVYLSPETRLGPVFASGKPGQGGNPLGQLSTREYQVFTLLVEGVRAKEIAASLELSPKTVDTYRASLMRKLNIFDVAGLVKFAISRKLIHPGG
jgi:DNA-binding NarL/FixJ family response regulator